RSRGRRQPRTRGSAVRARGGSARCFGWSATCGSRSRFHRYMVIFVGFAFRASPACSGWKRVTEQVRGSRLETLSQVLLAESAKSAGSASQRRAERGRAELAWNRASDLRHRAEHCGNWAQRGVYRAQNGRMALQEVLRRAPEERVNGHANR